ncbi:alpha-xenorhabdolysin family binary toxin subunit B [Pseudomonas sp. G.S.17]|uniref:alpha-xenorhabdolysin family binary toxin subunit B n=1 Tax=Pseudomonas sp. G.S.17 TaxID=3137451 RepID=UPI00311CD32D
MPTIFDPIQLDLETIRSCRDSIKTHVLDLDGLYLPTLQEKVRTLATDINEADDQARSTLALLPAALQVRAIQSALNILIKEAAQSGPVPAQHVAEMNSYLEDALSQTREHYNVLSMRLDNLRAFDTGNITDLQGSLNQQLEIQQTALNETENKRDRYTGDKQTLNAAMSVIEDKNLIDQFIPLLDAFTKLDPRSPQASLVRAAVVSVQNILRMASESVKYVDMVEARAKVQAELNSIAKELGDIKPRIKSLEQRIQQLSTAQALEQNVARYEEQVRKICTALLIFINAQQAPSNVSIVEDVEAFVANARALSDYVTDLRARWK